MAFSVLCYHRTMVFVLLKEMFSRFTIIIDNNWVTSSSIRNEVAIYDSKFTGYSSSLTHQLALFYRTELEEDGAATTWRE